MKKKVVIDNKKLTADKNYVIWIKELKEKVRAVQIKAAVKVNTELLNFYWELGQDIVEKQKNTKWGDGFLKQLSKDLSSEFLDIKGFSKRNLERIRKWYLFWNNESLFKTQAVRQLGNVNSQQSVTKKEKTNTTQAVSQLGTTIGQQIGALITQIPWGHNLVIISKCTDVKTALFYVNKTIENGWSRSVLTHQIESDLYNRSGKAITNFTATLPPAQSDLAKETLKDPYCFNFLTLTEKYNEKELENSLIKHLTKFLLELGKGFAYVGKQYKLEIDTDDFYIDLLFYHLELRCYVVIELKTDKFKPEYAGKLNFYISAIDSILKTEQDNPSIGILICKSKNNTVVEYSLRDIKKPIGVSEYKITKILPEIFQSTLPSIEEIEAELNKEIADEH